MDREAKAFEEAKEATISARAAAKAVMAAREEAMQEVADMIMETARNAPKMNMDAIWAAVQARDEAERAKEEERREAARRASEEEEQENARAEEAKAARQQVEAAAAAARQEAMNEVAKKLLESAKRAPKMDMKDIIRKAAAKEDVKV